MIRAVLDTNVYISALFWGGLPRTALEAGLRKEFLLMSESLLMELQQVLVREKFAKRLLEINLSVDAIVSNVRTATLVIEPAEVPPHVIRDPKDLTVLACAVGGSASYIVSGDKDLLVLGSYHSIPIVNTSQFMDHLSTK